MRIKFTFISFVISSFLLFYADISVSSSCAFTKLTEHTPSSIKSDEPGNETSEEIFIPETTQPIDNVIDGEPPP